MGFLPRGGGRDRTVEALCNLQCSKIKKFCNLTLIPRTTSWSDAQEGGSDTETCYERKPLVVRTLTTHILTVYKGKGG